FRDADACPFRPSPHQGPHAHARRIALAGPISRPGTCRDRPHAGRGYAGLAGEGLRALPAGGEGLVATRLLRQRQAKNCRAKTRTAAPARNMLIRPPRRATKPATRMAAHSAGPASSNAGATRVVSTAAGTAFRPASTRGWMLSKREITR